MLCTLVKIMTILGPWIYHQDIDRSVYAVQLYVLMWHDLGCLQLFNKRDLWFHTEAETQYSFPPLEFIVNSQ